MSILQNAHFLLILVLIVILKFRFKKAEDEDEDDDEKDFCARRKKAPSANIQAPGKFQAPNDYWQRVV
jgi:hypothetical protein